MTTPKRPRDPSQLAKFIVDVATGEAEETPPSAVIENNRRAGLKGGVARAAALSPDERKAIAEKAAQARWKKTS